MSIIKPFRALRPTPDKASRVASPPYDVLSSEEARAMAQGNPDSFLHVSKPEIDLDPDVDLYSDQVYAKGAENLARLHKDGVLFREERPCLYVYQQTMRIRDRDHVQVGVVAGASVAEYQSGLIKKHELTRADKEKDRTRHLDTLNVNSGPVFLTYKASDRIDALVDGVRAGKPVYDLVADDGIRHVVWVVDGVAAIAALTGEFAKLPNMYVADGHHRSAAASAVHDLRKAKNPHHTGEEGYNHFLAVIFPHDQMHIMDYNRVVKDLKGQSQGSFLNAVREKFEAEKTESPRPGRATEFGMFLGGQWYRLRARPGSYDGQDPVRSLDVSILQENLLAPLLGIGDPRRDKRIDFVGGIRGTAELERRVNGGWAVAFALHATSMDQLMAIADAGQIMPPKSTWFEPKLRSGLLVRPLD
ncbi:MAG: DUF1015 family protein [Deltaproteobacteria bacterium]|nr:DUF1015 family protein [Deltaproteobacteria bacterium]